jgi:hypothetical protein
MEYIILVEILESLTGLHEVLASLLFFKTLSTLNMVVEVTI